jgi:SAM-dependent methyltransferase
MRPNLDAQTVEGFGHEWEYYDQSTVDETELRTVFDQYFSHFPWSSLPEGAVGFDLGCGSGRWAKFVAPRVGLLHCIDASDAALASAKRNLESCVNCRLHHASVDNIPVHDRSMDFGYSLGVLHHVPDTLAGLKACVGKLKVGAPFLVYLYYAFDNRPAWFRTLWRASDLARRGISKLPPQGKRWLTEVIAASVYLPLARTAKALAWLGADVSSFPLSAYRELSFYTMRTDALDRFGTRLEQRFTRAQVEALMMEAGLEGVCVSPGEPFWCAVGFRAH